MKRFLDAFYEYRHQVGLKLPVIALVLALVLSPHFAWNIPVWAAFLLLFFGIILGSIYVKPPASDKKPFTFKNAIYQNSIVMLALLIGASLLVCLLICDYKPLFDNGWCPWDVEENKITDHFHNAIQQKQFTQAKQDIQKMRQHGNLRWADFMERQLSIYTHN